MQTRSDIAGLDIAVVDAENQDERDFGDEQQSEKESEAAQRFLPAFFKRHVVDLIDGVAEQVEDRQHDDAGHDRIDAELDIDEVGDVGAEDDESRVRDIDDVEHAERDRNAGGHRRVKSAEQQSCDNRVDQQIERKIHPRQASLFLFPA